MPEPITALDKRISRIPPVLAVGGRFGKYSPETDRDVRKPDVKQDEKLARMLEAWKAAHHTDIFVSPHYQWYDFSENAIKDLEYSAQDVERFVIALHEYQDEEHFSSRAGYFISALINNCRDDEFALHLEAMEGIAHLGEQNTKNLIIHGNAGSSLGHSMISGSITLFGDAGDHLAFGMKDGEVVVKGNARESAGHGMKGGVVVIEGNATSRPGDHMEGGRLVVGGNAGWQPGFEMHGGLLWIKGNAQGNVGAIMKDGFVLVEGDGGDEPGTWMSGGRISIKGNVGKDVGDYMSGGELHIGGNYESLSIERAYGRPAARGKIYHQGMLIMDR